MLGIHTELSCLQLESDSRKIKSMAVNILTFYKFNGKFIWKINIKYLLYQGPSGACIKHLSDSERDIAVKCWVLDWVQPFLDMARLCYLCWENIYFTSKTRKNSTLSLPPLKSTAACRWIVPLHITNEIQSCFLEEEGKCSFSADQRIIDSQPHTNRRACVMYNMKDTKTSLIYICTNTCLPLLWVLHMLS